MPVIQLLDQATINQIAAGEVIDRPASVVKELFENAVDAKATAVTVEIKEGGISLIRVTDNGCGIDKDQIALAFKRHATSKIHDIMDLVTVSSLGFRGEALSSIAAVAQVEMITKPAQTMLGVSYQIEDGEEKQMQEIGAPDGTTILVRNLFGHVPARRKFLKTAATEGSHIAQLMENMALSRPDLSVRFINNGQNKLYTTGNGRLHDLIYTIYGREIASNLLEIEVQTELFHVKGYLGKPIISRGNRSFENYFINGRFVKSALIAKAIETGYKSFMMQHRYPFTALYLTIDPELIDVNVHPAKMELRFRREEEIYQQLVSVIENCLHGKPLIPDVGLSEEKEKKEAVPKGTEPFETLRKQAQEEILPSTSGRPAYTAPKPAPGRSYPTAQEALRVRESSSSGIGTPGADGLDESHQSGLQGSVSAKTADSSKPTALVEPLEPSGIHRRIGQAEPGNSSDSAGGIEALWKNAVPKPDNRESSVKVVQQETGMRKEPPLQEKARAIQPADGTGRETTAEADTDSSYPLLSPEAVRHHKLIGQLFDTYWLIQYEDKLYIMDQHAAHEKVLYERLMAGYRKRERLSQMLSPAIMVTLAPVEESMLKEYRQVLEDMGYEIEAYGGNEYALCSVPANLYGIDEKEAFLDLISSLQDCSRGKAGEMVAHRLATMACKAAIKGNQKITFQEADALISQLLTLENPYACPHGRPIIISMSRYELEKKFKRIV